MRNLFVFFGMIASGKSTLASAFASRHGLPCYNTDLVRKELVGVAATTRCNAPWGEGIYSSSYSTKTYELLLEKSAADFARGAAAVVLDGSYLNPAERTRVVLWAERNKAVPWFIYCHCSDSITRARLERRATDPDAVSDGRLEILASQRAAFTWPEELDQTRLISLDTDAPLADLVQSLDRSLPTQ